MKQILAIFYFIFISTSTYAEVLLLPEQNLDFETYRSHCKKEGYICTTDFQISQIQQMETPEFELFLDQLDYSSVEFRNSLPQRLLKLLKEEMLSFEQIEINLKIIDQTKIFLSVQNQRQLEAIEKFLRELMKEIKESEITELPSEYIVIFKKALPLSFLKKIKPSSFKIKTFSVQYTKVSQANNEPFVSGRCEEAAVNAFVQKIKWQIDRSEPCSLSESLSQAQTTTTNFLNQNRTTFIVTSLVVVGAALLMNNYEMNFSF